MGASGIHESRLSLGIFDVPSLSGADLGSLWTMTLLRSLPTIAWLLLSALFFAFGEYLSKKWAFSPGWMLAITVVVVDAIGTFLWLPAILNRNVLSIVGMMWLLIGAIASVGIGLLIFHETLDWTQWLGLGFAFVALVLLGR